MSEVDEETLRIRDLQKRRAVFFLGDDDLRNILQLPENAHFFGVQYNWERRMLEVFVWGEPFDQVPDATEPPAIFAEREWDPETSTLKVTFPKGNYNG